LTTKQILEFEPNTSEKRKENSQGISISSGTNRRYIDESWPTIAGLSSLSFMKPSMGKSKDLGRAMSVHIWAMCVLTLVPGAHVWFFFG